MDRSRSRRREAARGFTLLEVIIAVTIVAILATLIVPRLTRYIGQAKDRRASGDQRGGERIQAHRHGR